MTGWLPALGLLLAIVSSPRLNNLRGVLLLDENEFVCIEGTVAKELTYSFDPAINIMRLNGVELPCQSAAPAPGIRVDDYRHVPFVERCQREGMSLPEAVCLCYSREEDFLQRLIDECINESDDCRHSLVCQIMTDPTYDGILSELRWTSEVKGGYFFKFYSRSAIDYLIPSLAKRIPSERIDATDRATGLVQRLEEFFRPDTDDIYRAFFYCKSGVFRFVTTRVRSEIDSLCVDCEVRGSAE